MPIRDGFRQLFSRLKSCETAAATKKVPVARLPAARRGGDPQRVYSAVGLHLVRTIGTGSYGRVFWARVKDRDGNLSDETVAVKRLTKAALIKQRQVQHVQQEKDILKQIEHPFIVKILNHYQDESYLYIVLEFVQGGEFFTYLRSKGRLLPADARFYSAAVLLMFEYLHGLDIIYRDLKPENLLIDEQGYLKLTDFGFAKRVVERTYTLCGTPEYVAPEVLTNKGHGKSVDWWTLGILIYEMVSSYTPFAANDVMQIYQNILGGKVMFSKEFDPDAKSICKHLLQHDLSRRFGTTQGGVDLIKEHRWFKNRIDFAQLLAKNIPAPYVPVVDPAESTNFNNYQECRQPAQPIPPEDDPFADW